MPPTAPPTAVAHLKLLNCARGHFWESAVNGDGSARTPACPTCGAPADVLPLLDLEATELPLPPPIPTPLPPPYQDKSGKPVVAGYEVLEDLGRTATGVAQRRAKQTVLNRLVVLKTVLARDDPSQQAWGALRGEASALAKLPHPNIVGIFESGERERQLFYNAIELVEGPTLAALLADKRLPVPQALALIELLARAVHFAHEKGIIHRGLRPETILLQVQRTDKKSTETAEPPACSVHALLCIPKITGFGLAKSRLVEGDVTDQELQDKFPCYLSPEQTWGRSKDIGPVTDVFALGAILYECLTGQPPFKGSSPGTTLEQIQTIDPLPIARLRKGGVPGDVEAIVRKCLHKQPRRRYPSARDLADDLRRAAEVRPTRARDANIFVRGYQWARRKPMTLATIAACVLGVIGMIWASWSANSKADTALMAKRTAEYELKILSKQQEKLIAALRPFRERAVDAEYLLSITKADRELERGTTQRAIEILGKCREDLRGVEWYVLQQQAENQERRPVRTLDMPTSSMAWSPDGENLAVAMGDRASVGGVVAWKTSRDVEPDWLHLTEGMSSIRQIAFSPDGTRLAWIGKDGLRVGSCNQNAPFFTHGDGQIKPVYYFTFAPDGRSLLVSGRSGIVTRLDPNRGSPQTDEFPIDRGDAPSRLVCLNPAGTRIAMVRPSNVQQVRIYSTTDPKIDLSWQSSTVTALAYHPGKACLASGNAGGRLRFWRVPFLPNDDRKEVLAHANMVNDLSFSHDGKRLASCGDDGTVRIWDVDTEQEMLSIPFKDGLPKAVAFSPTANRLAVAVGKQVYILGAEPARN